MMKIRLTFAATLICCAIILASLSQAQNGAYTSPALGASPGGASGQVQYNNGGAFGGIGGSAVGAGGALTLQPNTSGNGVLIQNLGSGAPLAVCNSTCSLSVSVSNAALLTAPLYATSANCTSAAGTCGAAAAGAVTIAAAASTVTVSTTAVTANSDISLTFNSAIGTRLGVTCNTTAQQPFVTTITAGTSFVISTAATFTTNPGCITYDIKN